MDVFDGVCWLSLAVAIPLSLYWVYDAWPLLGFRKPNKGEMRVQLLPVPEHLVRRCSSNGKTPLPI